MPFGSTGTFRGHSQWVRSCGDRCLLTTAPGSTKEAKMAQKGAAKQVPLDQRARGLNQQHKEGQANIQNQRAQKAAQPAPAPKKSSK